jgi:hypothetical protein
MPSPQELKPHELYKVLEASEIIKHWCDEVKAFAQAELERGAKVPGWKLVAKRSNRKWADEDVAATALSEVLGNDAFETSVISITKAEKLLKKLGHVLSEDLIVKPETGVVMAPESDPRKEVSPTASLDFINDEDFLN